MFHFIILLVLSYDISFVLAGDNSAPLDCSENFAKKKQLEVLTQHARDLNKLISPLLMKNDEVADAFQDPIFRNEMAELKLKDYEAISGEEITDIQKRNELKEQLVSEFMIELGPLGRSKIFYWALMKSLIESEVDSYESYQMFIKAFFDESFSSQVRSQFVNRVYERIDKVISEASISQEIVSFKRWQELGEQWEVEANDVPLIFNEWAEHTRDNQLVLQKMILTSLASMDESSFVRVLKEKNKEEELLNKSKVLSLLDSSQKVENTSSLTKYNITSPATVLTEKEIIQLATNRTSIFSANEVRKIQSTGVAGVTLITAIHKGMLVGGQAISILAPIGIGKYGVNFLRSKLNLNFAIFFKQLESGYPYMNEKQLAFALNYVNFIRPMLENEDLINKMWLIRGEVLDLISKKEFSEAFKARLIKLANGMSNLLNDYREIQKTEELISYNRQKLANLRSFKKSNSFHSMTYYQAVEHLIPLIGNEGDNIIQPIKIGFKENPYQKLGENVYSLIEKLEKRLESNIDELSDNVISRAREIRVKHI